MNNILRPVLVIFTALALVTGVAYPLLVTGIAQVLFRDEASGSVIERDGKPIGSALLGQPFSSPRYFWGRPSATGPQPYHGGASTGTNQATTNPALADAVTARVAALHAADPDNTAPVPVDLVTASGSGLDPHISLAAAEYQVARVARARGLDPARVRVIIESVREGRSFGILGEPRVNVLELNLAIDAMR
jgi:potassium-transporting ATPase KdpC subunit